VHFSAALWVLTLALIAGLLALDWRLLGRHPHRVSLGEALRWSLFYIAVAVLFGLGIGVIAGWDLGSQYFAGYLVEKSLSVDNLFVFVIIIGAFAVPAEQQPKVLTIGIVIALALRAVFIALGAALLATFSFMFLIFGLTLLATTVQLYRHRNEDPTVEDNALVAAARRKLPITDTYDHGRIITRLHGRWAFTPLLLALLAIGTSDLLFAFDSIPAVFGVTDHAYIVFAANAFALLGLRALYFLLAGLLGRLVYLSTGLAAILAFIGAKLVLEFAHQQHHSIPEIPTGPSLALIAAVLVATTVASLIKARRDPSTHAHAGALRQHHRDASPTTRVPDQDRAPRHASESLAAGSSDERPISDEAAPRRLQPLGREATDWPESGRPGPSAQPAQTLNRTLTKMESRLLDSSQDCRSFVESVIGCKRIVWSLAPSR
jgi:tellurite resistance protein TerC